MMSYALLTPGYGQSHEQAELYRRLVSKGEISSYPQAHVFFRSRLNAMPNNSKAPTTLRSLASNRNRRPPSQLSVEIGSNHGHAGALEKIYQMPVDILYEVSRLSSSSQMSGEWAEVEEKPVACARCAFDVGY
jgi:hypothetical protein